MEMNGLMGGFYKFSVVLTRLVLLNIIWLIFNFPIVYLVLSLVGSDFANLQTSGMLIGILTPFVFFPATSAMYGIARKWVMGEGDISIVRSFMTYYKENYKRSILGGIVFVLFWSGWIVNYLLFFEQQATLFIVIFIVITAFFFTWNAYYFSYIVHFELKFIPSLKNSFILTVGNPFSTVGVALISGGIIYLSLSFTFILPLCIGSLSAYFTFLYFHKVIQKTMKVLEMMDQKLNLSQHEEAID